MVISDGERRSGLYIDIPHLHIYLPTTYLPHDLSLVSLSTISTNHLRVRDGGTCSLPPGKFSRGFPVNV